MSERPSAADAPLRRVAIVNRGEAAVRVIRAVRELNLEHGWGTRTIALHTEAERRAMFVRDADEAVLITGPRPYRDHGELERALRASGADAAWVGWGYVAEDPAFAELCERNGIVFIGPPPDVIRRLGDEAGVKRLAEQAGLRVDAATAEDAAVPGAHRVGVQVFADAHGAVWAAGARDCSIRRGSRKLIEESSSPVLGAEQEGELRAAAVDLARSVGYRGAGTVEFLYRPDERAFMFTGFTACLQAEHVVTEMTTGLDLVKLQIHVAGGGHLEGEPPTPSGHAIEARLNAEDPERGFAPAPGTIELLALPSGPGVRVETGVAVGDGIAADDDATVAKVIGWGRDRAEARARLRRALAETTVVLRAGTTNKGFLLDMLDRPEMVAGTADAGWLDRVVAADGHVPTRHAGVALLAAAIDVYDSEQELERGAFYAAATRGRPRASDEIGRTVDLDHRGRSYRLAVAKTGPRRYRIEADGATVAVQAEPLRRFARRLVIGDDALTVHSVTDGPDRMVEVDGVTHRVSRERGGVVRAPAPALVVAITVAAGDEVEAGSTIAVLEAMKMEMTVVATHGGRVREVLAAASTHVDAGAPLVIVEPETVGDGMAPETPRIGFGAATAASQPAARLRARGHLDALRSLIMGFDVTVEAAGRLVRDFEQARTELPADDPELVHGELEILTIFADLAELSRNWPAAEREDLDEDGADRVRSPREHFRTYLHSLDVEREGLPETFVARLARALAHYGVPGLERTPELEEAVYRIFLAHQRAPSQVLVVMALLDRRLQQAEALPEPLRDEFHETLDRLIVAAQLRHPVIGELARSVRFRVFDQPVIEAARERVLAAARQELRYLAAHPDAPDRAERIDTMVSSPEPLIRLLAERIGGRDGQAPLLEVLTRRYYKIRELEDLRSRAARRPAVPHGPVSARRPPRAADHGRWPRSRSCPSSPRPPSGWPRRPPDMQSVIDLYLLWDDAPADPGRHGRGARRRRQPCGAARDGAQGGGGRQRRGRRGRASLHVPPGRRAASGGARHPRAAPDDLGAPASLAARELRRHAPAVGRGGPPLPLRRAREPVRRAPRRAGRGARPDAGARRVRPAHRRCPSPSASSPRASTASAACRPSARPTGGCTETRCSSTSGRSSRCRWTSCSRSRARWPRSPPGSASRRC